MDRFPKTTFIPNETLIKSRFLNNLQDYINDLNTYKVDSDRGTAGKLTVTNLTVEDDDPNGVGLTLNDCSVDINDGLIRVKGDQNSEIEVNGAKIEIRGDESSGTEVFNNFTAHHLASDNLTVAGYAEESNVEYSSRDGSGDYFNGKSYISATNASVNFCLDRAYSSKGTSVNGDKINDSKVLEKVATIAIVKNNQAPQLKYEQSILNKNGEPTKFVETYTLPESTTSAQSSAEYSILTSKNVVTVPQGGTGVASIKSGEVLVGNGDSSVKTKKLLGVDGKKDSITRSDFDKVASAGLVYSYCNKIVNSVGDGDPISLERGGTGGSNSSEALDNLGIGQNLTRVYAVTSATASISTANTYVDAVSFNAPSGKYVISVSIRTSDTAPVSVAIPAIITNGDNTYYGNTAILNVSEEVSSVTVKVTSAKQESVVVDVMLVNVGTYSSDDPQTLTNTLASETT